MKLPKAIHHGIYTVKRCKNANAKRLRTTYFPLCLITPPYYKTMQNFKDTVVLSTCCVITHLMHESEAYLGHPKHLRWSYL